MSDATAIVTATDPAPFVTQLRSRPGVIQVGAPAADAFELRVEMPEVWDTVRVSAAPTTPMSAIKAAALAELFPEALGASEFVLKLHGFEVLDESASVADTGARTGSIFLLTHRRRRPIR